MRRKKAHQGPRKMSKYSMKLTGLCNSYNSGSKSLESIKKCARFRLQNATINATRWALDSAFKRISTIYQSLKRTRIHHSISQKNTFFRAHIRWCIITKIQRTCRRLPHDFLFKNATFHLDFLPIGTGSIFARF